MAKVKNKIFWGRLIFSIIVAQSAGAIGTIFTISAIPTWYALLNKPSFSPPNWLFGPVWTILYTMIGVSFYIIWVKHNKKTFWMMKLFFFHLFLNAIWSIIFFGVKNLGLAFAEIILMWSTILFMIYKFKKVDKWASYLLIPYLLWVSFASILNFTIWRLNPSNTVNNVFAQDLDITRAHNDYVYSEDIYRKDLTDFNLKRSSYQKNSTLSLKEELRTSTFKFAQSRNILIKSYLLLIKNKGVEKTYEKIDPQIVWFSSRNNSYDENDSLEDILSKIKEEDSKYQTETLPAIYYSLAHISLGDVKSLKEKHKSLFSKLRSEAQNIISLGRANEGLFDRWFKDIEGELNNVSEIENESLNLLDKIYSEDNYKRDSGYQNVIDTLSPAKGHLLKLNGYIGELESVINDKR